MCNIKSRVTVSVILVCLLVLELTACTTKNSKAYGKKQVLEYVDEICKEPYELIEKELIEESPDNMEYRFRTKNRELYFKANSYLAPVVIDACETIFYRRHISCDYVNAVHDLYNDELNQVLAGDEHYLEEYGWIYVCSFSDLASVVKTVLAADEIYQKELAYNSPSFLEENALRSIHLVYQRSEEEAKMHETWTNMGDIAITGQNDPEELYNRLAGWYAQRYVDGEIEDGSDIPQRYLEDRHRTSLTSIELNGEEMLYDSKENPYGPYLLSTDGYRRCWYSEKMNSYMLAADIGLTSYNMSFPLIIREYVLALGGKYSNDSEGENCRSSWEIGDDKWVMTAKFCDNEILNLEIEKNGKPLEIHYVTSDEEWGVSATFCVGMTAEDFCRLFDLSYEIDEEKGIISFESEKMQEGIRL